MTTPEQVEPITDEEIERHKRGEAVFVVHEWLDRALARIRQDSETIKSWELEHQRVCGLVDERDETIKELHKEGQRLADAKTTLDSHAFSLRTDNAALREEVERLREEVQSEFNR